jgi:uncharacterized protein YcfL
MKTLVLLLLSVLLLAACERRKDYNSFHEIDIVMELTTSCLARGGVFSIKEEGIQIKSSNYYCTIAGKDFRVD